MAEKLDQDTVSQAAEAQPMETSEFEGLLQKEFKPKTDRAREAVQTAVQTLALQALEQTTLISDDAVRTI
jgi:type VI secretion system protein ImpC